MRRLILIFGMILFTVVAVVAVGYGIYLGTGKSAWLSWKAQREAMGDRFEWAVLDPPPVPDEENFALDPLVAGGIRGKDLDPRFKALKLPNLDAVRGDWREGRRADLAGYAQSIGIQDLEGLLGPLEPTLAELDRASRRSGCRLPVDHAAWEPGGLLGFRDAAKTLRLRALLRLTQGTPEGAAGDVGTCLRIAEHLKGEPELIPLLLRTSLVGLVLQPVWEGLADHRWGEAQLSEIQALLTGVDLLSSARLAWEGERLHGIDVLRSVVEAGVGPFQLSKEAISTRDRLAASTGIVGRLYRGWIYRNLLELARFETELTIDVFPKGGRRVLTKGGTPQSRMAAFERRHRDLALARLAMPALLAQVQRIAHLQASVDLAGVACALERHRLARGDFPERLEVLVPEFIRELPRDLVTGGPLVYRRTPEGAFVLYSTGWDGKDQGGVLGRSKEDPRTLDPATGDWPWFAQAQ